MRLGVNIDHVATLRQARRTDEPDPVWAAAICEAAGAEAIIVHLREDRRHVNDRDVRILRQTVASRLNLEMGISDDIVRVALDVKPPQATFVPEKRQELTTEGGLNVAGDLARVADHVRRFRDAGIEVSLFIDPEPAQVDAAAKAGATIVEIHTGDYANGGPVGRVADAARRAKAAGLRVFAGHGLTYRNVKPVAAIPEIEELSIGHSIVSRAVLIGLDRAVREMKELIHV